MKAVIAGVVGFVLGLLAAAAVENALFAGEASKNRRALADADTISIALEQYRKDNGTYPPLENGLDGAAPQLVPNYLVQIPDHDAYGHKFVVSADKNGVNIVSMGRNGFLVRNGTAVVSPNESLGKLR